MRHAVIIGHGDNDPHGIDLNDDCNYEIVENGLDLGIPTLDALATAAVIHAPPLTRLQEAAPIRHAGGAAGTAGRRAGDAAGDGAHTCRCVILRT